MHWSKIWVAGKHFVGNVTLFSGPQKTDILPKLVCPESPSNTLHNVSIYQAGELTPLGVRQWEGALEDGDTAVVFGETGEHFLFVLLKNRFP